MQSVNVEFSDAWRHIVALPDQSWRLAEAALCAATHEFPNLPVKEYLTHLDVMQHELARCVSSEQTVEAKIQILNHYFFVEQGFSGNTTEYYDPRNSYLNEVMDRKTGIPISLSILYLELAQAIHLNAYGINFPGHFLVGVQAGDRRWALDIYDQGRDLSSSELKILLSKLQKDDLGMLPELAPHLKPASNLKIIVRLLRNLKKAYIDKQDVGRALHVIAMILSLLPDSPDEIRDRGMIYQHIDYARGAVADLVRYLELAPEAQERALIESMLESLQQRNTRLH
jgi:regulator of sirC expression with transglutaminase-like and TPR domain